MPSQSGVSWLASQKKEPGKTPGPKTKSKYTPIASGSKYLTVREFADLFKLSPISVRRHCENGNIPGAIKFGTLWRIPVKEEDLPC